MKAISIGDKYQVYGNSLQAYDSIPAYTYNVRFDEMTGFYLKVRSKLAVKEKTYGTHPEKAEKVLRTFSVFERNLGVILSGDKGIGKSLFARMLAEKAQDAGYPVLIIDQFIPGIANYIQSIDQEAVFLFDEFDKTFGGVRPGDNETDPQASLLSMFDGTSDGKKLFIITCNSLDNLILHYNEHYKDPAVAQYKALRPDYLSISRVGEPVLHYWTDGRVKGQLSSNRVGRMIKDAYLPF